MKSVKRPVSLHVPAPDGRRPIDAAMENAAWRLNGICPSVLAPSARLLIGAALIDTAAAHGDPDRGLLEWEDWMVEGGVQLDEATTERVFEIGEPFEVEEADGWDRCPAVTAAAKSAMLMAPAEFPPVPGAPSPATVMATLERRCSRTTVAGHLFAGALLMTMLGSDGLAAWRRWLDAGDGRWGFPAKKWGSYGSEAAWGAIYHGGRGRHLRRIGPIRGKHHDLPPMEKRAGTMWTQPRAFYRITRMKSINHPSWKLVRAQAMERDGHKCRAEGCDQPAAHVDHIIERADGGARFDLDNCRSMCAECHSDKTDDSAVARGNEPPRFADR